MFINSKLLVTLSDENTIFSVFLRTENDELPIRYYFII